MNWLRWYSGTASDPKFLVVSRKSGQNVAAVIAVWAMLLERASEDSRTQPNATERGCIEGFDCEAADAVLGLDDGAACSIVEAMHERGLLSDGRISNWEKRQPKREDGSAERAKKWREKNASERKRTLANARGEESRVEERREEEERREGEARAPEDTTPKPSAPSRPSRSAKKPQPEKSRFGENGNVLLTAGEYAALCQKFTPELTDKAVAFLDLHIGAKGKDEYKSHNLAMQKWVFDAVKEREQRHGGPSRASPQSRPMTRDEQVRAHNDAVFQQLMEESRGLQS